MAELICDGVGLDKILHDLGYDLNKQPDCCHLDPDLVASRRKEPVKDWCPAFGQINQAAGYFDYNPKRVLTMEGKTKATWKYEEAYQCDNLVKTKRKNSAKNGEGIYYAGIGQEIVLDDNKTTENWAKKLF